LQDLTQNAVDLLCVFVKVFNVVRPHWEEEEEKQQQITLLSPIY
jgi:hypothetical protein